MTKTLLLLLGLLASQSSAPLTPPKGGTNVNLPFGEVGGAWIEGGFPDSLRRFTDYQLRVRHARALGLDTLTAPPTFPKGRLLLVPPSGELRGAFIRHITLRVPVREGQARRKTARALADSLRARLVAGEDFTTLARRYSDEGDGEAEWMIVDRLPEEWIATLDTLPPGQPSAPFSSPRGIHIVEKESPSIQAPPTSPKGRLLLVPLSEGMEEAWLSAVVERLLRADGNDCREDDLRAWYESHKEDYRRELPAFRGTIAYCKDKSSATALKKRLKKKQAPLNPPEGDMETGLFPIGTHAAVDKLVFHQGDWQPDAARSYVFTVGKKLKAGSLQTYEEARGRVKADYRARLRERRMEELRRIYQTGTSR